MFAVANGGQLTLAKWSSNNETPLADLVQELNMAVHVALLKQDNKPLVLDYAYAPHTREHLAMYTLSPDKPLPRRKAVYTFEAADENELAVSAGDQVEILFERTDGWVIALLNGISGLVPLNHLEP